MVTRVDKKPLLYNNTLLRAWKPTVVAENKTNLKKLITTAKGYRVPDVEARDILDDYEDIDYSMRVFGVDDPYFEAITGISDEDDDETIRMARVFVSREKDIRMAMRKKASMEDVSKIQLNILKEVGNVYYGTEAVYAILHEAYCGNLVGNMCKPRYKDWVTNTAKKVVMYQSSYVFTHPSGFSDYTDEAGWNVDTESWYAWDFYKKIEQVSLRVSSKKNLLAHASLYGINRKGFIPSKDPWEDFEIMFDNELGMKGDVKLYFIMGIKYFIIGANAYVLSADDCVNLATMAQCYYRTALYFVRLNGYAHNASRTAITILKDMTSHCVRLINSKKNFSNFIRSIHILAQAEFNDANEERMGVDLGWMERSVNYAKESKELDGMGRTYFDRIVALAKNPMDRLNVCFMYHAFVGDDMLVSDLEEKVRSMPGKVRDADSFEWANFIKFCKAYLLSRFMMVHKRKPRVGGDSSLLNDSWANKCIGGRFQMPPVQEWGKVWIENEFSCTRFADTWHLDAQDVSYVMKDSAGHLAGKYAGDKVVHSELLMAMTSGNILDPISKSTPESARERLREGIAAREVVVSTAPKAENAKPSWKKRVTFAADNEFRKMQAEHDRNCRKIMSFVRGPSLGVDQCILETQFSEICKATSLGISGGICSHDISAWSESMDRARKFEFESVLTDMIEGCSTKNIHLDWAQITAMVSKQGYKEKITLTNGSFQGFDGSASTLLHSMILLYCIDTARRAEIMSKTIRTNMATLIDDCIALMEGLTSISEATAFWDHLKKMYLKLGFEVDNLKSIFSTIKAIYLSRRFMMGGEVPSDYKIFVKTHMSYEDPLRCSMDAVNDIFGALRGAVDANGDLLYIYYVAVHSALAEIVYYNPKVREIHPPGAAIFALAPHSENGWGFPSMVDWCTNDVSDKRAHFNALLESMAIHECGSEAFKAGIHVFGNDTARAIMAIKSQAWRQVSNSAIFTNPFEAIRDGPLKPDMLKRNAVQDILKEVATSSPWKELMAWNTSTTTEKVRQLLISTGPLHAPTLAALVNCMPDNYRLSMLGKAMGSQSLFDLLPRGHRSVLKRRVIKSASNFFSYCVEIYKMTKDRYEAADLGALTYVERTVLEREEFYTSNGVHMTDHTFPDPVWSFTSSAIYTGSVMSPNSNSMMVWDKRERRARVVNELISPKGIYVPRRSGRVWEITSEYAKGWDTVSQRIAMGLAILARAEADGHSVEGLLVYFTKAWNELSNITPKDTHLISINGAIKRLDANPGSSTHPVICHRNILKGFNNKFKTALDVIPDELSKNNGSRAHLHDFLSHETCMLAATCIQFCILHYVGVGHLPTAHKISARPDTMVAESKERMRTGLAYDRICIEIMDGEDNYGLLQACPELAEQIAIPTMKASWVTMINALLDGDHASCESLRKQVTSIDIDSVLIDLENAEAEYSSNVLLAGDPAKRGSITVSSSERYAMVLRDEPSRALGDSYTSGIQTISSRLSRELISEQPAYIQYAVVIRSILWERLKTKSISALVSVYYQDPDCDYSILKDISSVNFWRGIVIEVAKVARGKLVSECFVGGCKSLGVPGIHLSASNEIKEITHSVSSFFGANLRSVTIMVSDLILSIAGRKAAHYEKPLMQRVITNNPSVANAKLRKEHMVALVSYNLENLSARLERIANKKVQHRGDKRAIEINKRARIVELRCRRYVYLHISINERGEASLKEEDFARHINDCAKRVAEKVGLFKELIPEGKKTFEGALDDMHVYNAALEDMRKEYNKDKPEDEKIKGDFGWCPESGNIGARMAYDQVMSDSLQVSSTKFALSAAEIAPRVHRRVKITPGGEPDIAAAAPVTEVETGGGFFDDDIDIDLDDDMDSIFQAMEGVALLNIPCWKALFTLLLAGVYNYSNIEGKLQIDLNDDFTQNDLLDAHLETFTDAEVRKACPSIVTDYVNSGLLWDEGMLEREDADAYTTDELGKVAGPFLF